MPEPESDQLVVCLKCGIPKPLSKFSSQIQRDILSGKSPRHCTGGRIWCEDCVKENARRRSCKTVLKKHREDLKHDPDRLSTKFIADVSECSCRVVDAKLAKINKYS